MVSLAHDVIDIGSGTLTLIAGTDITAANATGTAEITTDGNVTLTAATIGSSSNHLELTGDAGGDRAFNIDLG